MSSEKENINIIQRSGNHLLTLINQVLDLSKIEAGHITIEQNDFDLTNLLDELENMLSLKPDKQHLTLQFDCAPDVPRHIRTDEVKLRQVLINLLSNAIKFTDEGSVRLRVSLKNHTDPESREASRRPLSSPEKYVIQFEIEDTGSGIAPEEMDQLFKAFEQTAAGREAREGTGLGLLISHEFVQLMGGDMHVTSEVGQGTTFSFDIRVQVVDAADMTLETPTCRAIALQPGQPRFRMLIVDDKHDNRQLLIKTLNPFGFDLQEAENGQEAIDILETWKPHLILMDMRMPVMDGYEATKRIRAMAPSIPPLLIIAVTAGVFEDEQETVLSIGCDDIVIKPFKENDIVAILRKHLNVRFVYADDETTVGKTIFNNDKSSLNLADFNVLPKATVEKFKKAVATLEMDIVLTIIEEISELDQPLADALKQLVDSYRFDKLQKLLEKS
jgi:CheY-like chemotaxis protein